MGLCSSKGKSCTSAGVCSADPLTAGLFMASFTSEFAKASCTMPHTSSQQMVARHICTV